MRNADYFSFGGGGVCVLSSTFSEPLRVAFAPLLTTFFVPRLILRPAFLVALAVEWAASLVSCLSPPVSCCANAPNESSRENTNTNNNLSFMSYLGFEVRFSGARSGCHDH